MTTLIGHTPVIPPEPKYPNRYMPRPEAKWTRDNEVAMTIAEILEQATKRGFYLCYMREQTPGKQWHARFERIEFEPGKTRARDGSYAATALEAVYTAFEEIDNPGVNTKRHMEAVNAKWAKQGILLRPLDVDPYAMQKFLRDDPGLALRLEDAVRGLLNSLTGEEDEDDVA